MCEVLKSNFEEAFPQVERAIKNADFIAFDLEFSGLTAFENEQNSLFDTPEVRYHKLRRSVSQLTVTQIDSDTFGKQFLTWLFVGNVVFRRIKKSLLKTHLFQHACPPKPVFWYCLSAFVKGATCSIGNNFLAQTFNFYLYPSAFGPVDIRFVFQSSCGHFLSRYKFDFNKFFYEGIPFLNEDQETVINYYLENPVKFSASRIDDERELQQCCSLVANWLISSEEKDKNSLVIDIPAGRIESLVLIELRNRFPQVWVTVNNKKIEVLRVSPEERKKLFEENNEKELNRIHDQALGFTRVFRLLIKYKKALVGHNCFMDLLFMYEKFYKTLPKQYYQFKSDVHQLFPEIIDTKHLSLAAKPIFNNFRLFENTVLDDLHKSLKTLNTKLVTLYPPTISHAPGFERYNSSECPHEAGYDAFMCGSVLLYTAHLLASNGLRTEDVRPLLFRQYLTALRPYINSINLIRAASGTVKLDGQDSESLQKTQWLFVELLKSSKSQTHVISQLTNILAQFGNVDFQLQSDRGAIVATGHPRCARDILMSLKGNKDVRVSKYNAWRHDPRLRTTMWAGAVVCGSLCGLLLWSVLQK